MHASRSVLLVVAMLTMLAAFSSCRSCQNEAEEQVGCNADDCDAGEVRFGDVCLQPVKPGGPCNGVFDPICARDGNDAYVCLNGTCQQGPGFIEECTVGKPCAFSFQHNQPTYCKDKSCYGVSVDRCSLYADIYVWCVWVWVGAKCAACKPGLNCDYQKGICLKPCADDGECPCAADGTPTSLCIPHGDDSQVCAPCVERTGCSADQPCCDRSKDCVAGECCTPRGDACQGTAECCGSDICLDGACMACRARGEACGSDAECCSGNECNSGICRERCDPGAACKVPGQQGVCGDGQIVCGPNGPSCQATSGPSPEVCNGRDDDCNGEIDDIAPMPCMATNLSGCQSGFEAPGTTACVAQKQECVPGQVCKICGPGCGECAATPCTPGLTACVPSAVCAGAAGMEECNFDNTCANPTPACWLPSDVGLPPNHCYSP